MQLTAFTDFALRALMRLAGDPGRTFTTDEIAREFGVSRNHLTKIVHQLGRAGILETRRGAGGGIRLARPAERITLGEIVRLLESRYPLVECFRQDGGGCALTPRCRLKRHLSAAREAFFRELDKTALSQCAYPSSPVSR